ncbi:MAG: protein kinase, partial [Actinomycetota bacterium]
YIAMRYLAGTDLKSLIEAEGVLDPRRTVSIITQVAGALDAAHGHGLIHRDVKSANVLIEPGSGSLGDRAYLTDFGLTKRPESISGLTKTGQFLGSVEYAAPEQFEGKPLTPRTDVYALGCVLFESLTGNAPYERESEAAVMYAHLREAVPRPSATRPELPPGLDLVVAAAMAKSSSERYGTAGELARAAQQALAPGAGPQAGGRGRSRAALIVTVGAILAGVVAAVALALRPGPAPEPADPTITSAGTAFVGLVRIDPGTNRVSGRIPLQGVAGRSFARGLVAPSDEAVWVSDGLDRLHKINTATNTLVDTIRVDSSNGAVVWGFGYVWVLGEGTRTTQAVRKIDPRTNRVVDEIFSFGCCSGRMAVGEGAVWILSPGGLYRIQPRASRARHVAELTGQAIAVGEGAVWILDAVSTTLAKVDPNTGRALDTISLVGSPLAFAVGEGAVWVVDQEGGQVVKVPVGGAGGIETIGVGRDPSAIAVGEGAVWVVNRGEGSVTRVEPTGGETTTIRIGGTIDEIAVGGSGVWVK